MQFKPRAREDRTQLAGLPGWFSALLRIRGIDTPEKAERFLHPSPADLHDPMLMQDMDKAIRLIREGIEKHRKFLVYGDYDTDGICACCIMLSAIRAAGGEAESHIPLRHTDGYGLNAALIDKISREYQYLITVDCGITNIEEVTAARQAGLTVIVTDHHRPSDKPCPADAVLDPLLGSYPFPYLCGAGVAFKVFQALHGLDGACSVLDLAALATVADIVPLIDENRYIVTDGLKRLSESTRPGVRELFRISGITPPVCSADISFRIAPRLNAAGRVEDASPGVELLMTDDPINAAGIAARFEENNRRRRRLELQTNAEAAAMIPNAADLRDDRLIVVEGKDWNVGLLGLIAGKLSEQYHLPSVALSIQGEQATGSCRSIPGVNIHALLSKCSDLFIHFWGHEQAAGITIPVANIPEFRQRLNSLIKEEYDDSSFLAYHEYDIAMPIDNINSDFMHHLEILEPTGCGNPSPVFLARGVCISEARRVGGLGKHLKLRIQEGIKTLDGIAFSQGEMDKYGGQTVDLLYTPQISNFNNHVSIQLLVHCLKPSSAAPALPDPDMILCELLRAVSRLSPAPDTASPLPMISQKETVERLLRPIGTLVLTRDRETALSLGQAAGIIPAFLELNENRNYSAILCVPNPEKLKDEWTSVILADGCALPGELPAIREKCPRAEIVVMDAPDTTLRLLRSLCLTDEQLRALYRAVRSSGFRTLQELGDAAGLTGYQVIAGLTAFHETALVRWHPAPFSVHLLPPVKCSMDDSPLNRYLRAL